MISIESERTEFDGRFQDSCIYRVENILFLIETDKPSASIIISNHDTPLSIQDFV